MRGHLSSCAGAALALCCALWLAGCIHLIPLDSYTPPPEPKPESGPGHVSGTVSVQAPVLTLLERPDASQPMGVAPLSYPGSIGLFRTNGAEPVRALDSWHQTGAQLRAPAAWVYAFDFTDVPLANYQIRLYTTYSPDWDIVEYDPFYFGEPFKLETAAPTLSGREESLSIFEGEAPASLRGKLLIDGNLPDGAKVTFLLQQVLPPPPDDEVTWPEPPAPGVTYVVGVGQTRLGRVFFSLDGLSLGQWYCTAWGATDDSVMPSSTEVFVNGARAVQGRFELTDGDAPAEMQVHTGNYESGLSGAGDLDPQREGLIYCLVTVAGGDAWGFDLVVSAERVGGIRDCNDVAYCHVPPQELLGGNHKQCRLGLLRPGDYIIRAWRLGASNVAAPILLAESAAPVTIDPPAPLPDMVFTSLSLDLSTASP